MRSAVRRVLTTILLFGLAGCATAPPSDINDICAIFAEQPDWYPYAKAAERRWGTPLPTLLAFVRQESGFRSDARPPRHWYLGFIPGPRPSDAYGYPQALDGTWEDYQDATGNTWADRDEFDDAVDFIGWYNDLSWRRNGISKHDPYHQYLAYHEGHGGYARGTWRGKAWLQNTAHRVAARAAGYRRQLQRCEDGLADDDAWWWPF